MPWLCFSLEWGGREGAEGAREGVQVRASAVQLYDFSAYMYTYICIYIYDTYVRARHRPPPSRLLGLYLSLFAKHRRVASCLSDFGEKLLVASVGSCLRLGLRCAAWSYKTGRGRAGAERVARMEHWSCCVLERGALGPSDTKVQTSQVGKRKSLLQRTFIKIKMHRAPPPSRVIIGHF